ncbi:MAG: hypothetical protein L3J39_13680 [Verrucomicrobiales bacterium]|nr:hypothetical protein [Verrucomicrobiales bacterium]
MHSSLHQNGHPTRDDSCRGTSPCRHLMALLLSALIALLACSCTRTITTKRRSYSISGSGSDGAPDDSDKMRDQYASGFERGEDGMMKSNKKELYKDQSFRNAKTNGKGAEHKLFRNGKKDWSMKEFRTPEYLTRQQDYRTRESNISKDARESDVDRFTTADGDQVARIRNRKSGFLDWLNPFNNKSEFYGANKGYRTGGNRTGARAISSAAEPIPMSSIGAGPQDQVNQSLSMDDVKKMLNPASYRKR